jgi:hypothetical protein
MSHDEMVDLGEGGGRGGTPGLDYYAPSMHAIVLTCLSINNYYVQYL